MSDYWKRFGETAGQAFGGIILLGLVAGGVQGVHGYLWGEQEGHVRTEDCRATVWVKPGTSETWFKKFTCNTARSQSGKIVMGRCAYVETEGPVCKTAYVYDQKPEITCKDPNFPTPGIDDQCHP